MKIQKNKAIFTVINADWTDIFNVFLESWIHDKPDDVDFILYHDGSVDINKINYKPDIFKEIPSDTKDLKKEDHHKHHKETWGINASRIFIIENLRDKYDKVIYLDADMIVLDINSLLNIETDKYIAAVKAEFDNDLIPMIEKDMNIDVTKYLRHIEHININPNGYFNAGMMILNMMKIRQLPFNIKEVFKKTHGSLLFNDQDFLNLIFSKEVEYLDRTYNYMPLPVLNKGVLYSNNIKDYHTSFSENPKVIHYLSGWRPWEDRFIVKKEIFDIRNIIVFYMTIFNKTRNLSQDFKNKININYKNYKKWE